MINFNMPFHPYSCLFVDYFFVLACREKDSRAIFSFFSFTVQINSFASLHYNFFKLLVSKIIISHFYKILLNGRWQASSAEIAFFEITFDWFFTAVRVLWGENQKLQSARIVFRINKKHWQLLISLASTNSLPFCLSHDQWDFI